MCQHLATGYVPASCYRICANILLQDMCQHIITGRADILLQDVPAPHYRICTNTLLQDTCQNLTTGYVLTPCYRICASTSHIKRYPFFWHVMPYHPFLIGPRFFPLSSNWLHHTSTFMHLPVLQHSSRTFKLLKMRKHYIVPRLQERNT